MADLIGFHHVALTVSNLDVSATWYPNTALVIDPWVAE